MHWPKFLAETDYRKPRDDKNSCYIDAFPEKRGFFERCSANPVHQESFSSFMDLWAKQKRPWPEFYDTETLLEGADLSDGSAFVVDVGGHHGIDLLRVLGKHPDIPAGSLVLEDLPDVVASVNLTTDKIKVMGHDLFGRHISQPVRGKYLFRPTKKRLLQKTDTQGNVKVAERTIYMPSFMTGRMIRQLKF